MMQYLLSFVCIAGKEGKYIIILPGHLSGEGFIVILWKEIEELTEGLKRP